MEFSTDTQRRLAEVLESLHIDAEYWPEPGYFELKGNLSYIYEKNIPGIVRNFAIENNHALVKIQPDGSFFIEDKENKSIQASIIHCNKCRNFTFVKTLARGETLCPLCKSNSVRYLAKDKIPGWLGSKKESLFDESELSKRLDTIEEDTKDRIETIISHLKGTPKYIQIDPEKTKKIEGLKDKYPNMIEVIDYILMNIKASSIRKNKEISFKPIVLVGGPGCGKSSFTAELCQLIMDKPALKLDLGNSVANFTLSGSDPSFKLARHGLIIEAMFSDKDGHPLKNPIIHLDELDKIKHEATYSVESVFYSMLEKSNSKRFFDNYIGINVDASGINYIFTANHLETIPEAIINRLKVFKIADYTYKQLKDNVLNNFYEKWLSNNNMRREFLPAVLSEEIKERILDYCHSDTRSIEDALVQVYNDTCTTDPESKQQIALFSPQELLNGWKNYRGWPLISKEHWQLPLPFQPKKEDKEKPFNIDDYLENYNSDMEKWDTAS